MNDTIKHITNEQELDAVLAFSQSILGHRPEEDDPNDPYSRENWVKRLNSSYRDLLLYAEADGKVVGIVFGRTDDDENITVGPVAIAENCREQGIARRLMLLLEERALHHGIHHLALGAVESAEGFYQKLGYSGTLLIQSEKHSIEELLALNTGYKVVNTNLYEGTVSQVFIELPAPDRKFQRMYENTLPGCYTMMAFGKTI